jgi:two-component system chemotaxis response regulator CheB
MSYIQDFQKKNKLKEDVIMIIKKLKAEGQNQFVFTVTPNIGLLRVKNTDGSLEVLVLTLSNKDLMDNTERLSLISIESEVKYIGGNQIFDEIIHEVPRWSKMEKKYIITESTLVYYDFQKDNFRIQKSNINLDKNSIQESNPNDLPSLKKKVLIIDDSKVIQKLLNNIIESSPEFEVCGVADRPSKAREFIELNPPDLITLDIFMPEMTGVEFLKQYLVHKRIPTILISSLGAIEGPLVMEGLTFGAQTYVQKPSMENFDETKIEILEKLKILSQMKSKKIGQNISAKPVSSNLNENNFNNYEGIITIGSSTGGTQALQEVLTVMPPNIPPIIIVQHIPEVFSKALADRLNQLCPFEVVEAHDGEEIHPNKVYIAPGGKQMKVTNYLGKKIIRVNNDPPLNRFRPSVDYLFESLVDFISPKMVAVILTGMGKDGAQGLLKLKQSGAQTLAQDEETSIVYGMPREAIEIGAADGGTPIHLMAQEIIKKYNSRK